MKTTIITLAVFTLLLTGCSVISSRNPDLSPAPVSYKIEIIKSEVNKNHLEFTAKNNSSVVGLLIASGTDYQMTGNKLTKLDGVITTAAKNWNLYLDGNKTDLETNINNNTVIEFRYEAKQ